MPLIVPIAGAYTSTYTVPSGSPVSMGIMDDNGYELSWVTHGEAINRTDTYAHTLIEGIYQGGDFRCRFRGREWSLGLFRPSWPWGDSGAAPGIRLGVIGRRWTSVAGQLILNNTAGTPAASSPASLTAQLAIISHQTMVQTFLTSRSRDLPIELHCIPDTVSSNVVPWSIT